MKPRFSAGANIAMKVPDHEFDTTISFYRDVLGLLVVSGEADSSTESVRFEFGDKTLWIDRVPGLSQAEIWLEIVTDDAELAARHFQQQGYVRRDEIEQLPDGFHGFWISSPCNIIHLVTAQDGAERRTSP